MSDFEDDQWWREFTEQEIEWYRLWFEFLKLTDTTKRSAEVSKYFGDVATTFEAWWPDHQYLFFTVEPFIIHEVITDEDFQGYKDSLPTEEDAGIVTIALHMYATKQQLRDAFEAILSKYHRGSAGRPAFERDGDYFSFHSRPDAAMLKKILAVYQVYSRERDKPADDRMQLWQIEEEVSAQAITLIDKTSNKATYLWTRKDHDPQTIEERRRSQHTTIRKYLNYAEEIIANVVEGRFPVYTVSNSKD